MKELGVFFTCFDELEATRFSLDCLKKVYPDIKIYLVHEGNVDFSFLEKEISHIKTTKVPDTMTNALKITPQDFRTPHNQEHLRSAVSAVLGRLHAAIQYCQTEHMIMLDPDAIVRGRLTIPDGVGLLGCRGNVNPAIMQDLNIFLKSHGGIEITAWGATPAIFNVAKFQKALNIFLGKKLVYDYCNSFYWAFAHDVLLPTLFALIGEEETYNPELVQCEWNPNWRQTNCPLLHQFRYYYPKRTTKYHANQ